ncbi:MAG: protein kinase [Planctomycetaceae bacterium]
MEQPPGDRENNAPKVSHDSLEREDCHSSKPATSEESSAAKTQLIVPEDLAAGVSDTAHMDCIEANIDLAEDAFPPGTEIGSFEILSELGRGGMGLVLKARDKRLHREVAIKVVSSSSPQAGIMTQRFLRESRIIANLEHPGVAPIYELGIAPSGQRFFAMRLVDGESLECLMQRVPVGDWELPRLLKIYEQVCQTMAFAHSRGVIHRDLKPANIMIGDYGTVRVMDWGLAKELSESAAPHEDPQASSITQTLSSDNLLDTQQGTVMGTLAYLPPEQAEGELAKTDQRADVFSLGGILCEILTGLPPYPATDIREAYHCARQAALDDAYRRLDECGANLQLVNLARSCLQKNPSNRPADASALAAKVTSILESNIQQAERDLVRFFELSLDLFCIAGVDGYFRRINMNFSRVLGYSEEDLLNRPFLDFVHDDDKEQTLQAVEQLSSGQPVVRFKNRYRCASGKYLTLEWTSKSVPERGLIYAVARDLTNRS